MFSPVVEESFEGAMLLNFVHLWDQHFAETDIWDDHYRERFERPAAGYEAWDENTVVRSKGVKQPGALMVFGSAAYFF